jgi:hypothetical protein
MELFGALASEVVEANSLKDMVGPCGLEPQTSTVSTRGHQVPTTGSKIIALVLVWSVEDLVVRSGSRGFGVAGSFWPCAFASIVW